MNAPVCARCDQPIRDGREPYGTTLEGQRVVYWHATPDFCLVAIGRALAAGVAKLAASRSPPGCLFDLRVDP